MIIKHNDKKNAESIIEASMRQMKYTLTLEIKEESAFNIIRNIYECFRMLGDALLLHQGRFSEDHIEQIKALEGLEIKLKRPIKIVDSLRRMRHNINYYGYNPEKIEAEDAVDFAKSCFYPLFDEVKKIIKKL